MTNIDNPRGFVPVRHLNGNPYCGTYNEYPIADGTTSAIFTGDPVVLTAAGVVEQAAAGGKVLGVFQGCFYTACGDKKPTYSPYWPASQAAGDAVAFVVDDPDVIFEVQSDGATASTDVGLAYDLVSGVGNTNHGRSAYELDDSTGTTGGDETFRLIGFARRADNVVASGNVDVHVLINEHFYRGIGATGV